jgi:hypothetical protein
MTASAGRAYYAAETVTYFHGTCEIYTPVTQDEEDAAGRHCICTDHMRNYQDGCPSMAGGSRIESVECPHRHKDPAAARECGRRMADREVRRRNRAQRGEMK